MPERFLLQILRHLVTRGILRSTRGVDGGYALERPPQDISLLEIIEALEGPLNSALPEGDARASHYHERLNKALQQVTVLVRQRLDAIKLADLMSPPPHAKAH